MQKELTYDQKKKFITELIAQAPGDLRGLFSQYRISKPLNPINLAAAIKQFGPKFVDRLYQIYSEVKNRNARAFAYSGGSSTNGLFGGGASPTAPDGESSAEPTERLSRFDFGNILGGAADLWEQINISAGKNPPQLVEQNNPQNPSSTAAPLNSSAGFDWSFKNPIIKVVTAIIVLGAAFYFWKKLRP